MLKTVGNPSVRSGDQTILNGNLVIGTAGKGIDFSADPSSPGMTSELLDDYEEGTWSGELRGSTARATTPVIVSGQYTKIGRSVTVMINFFNVNTTGASGDMQITGLPFTALGGSGDAAFIGAYMSFGLSAPNAFCSARIYGAGTTIDFESMVDNGSWSEVQITAGATKFLQTTITYNTL
jgi:hypothetical protein